MIFTAAVLNNKRAHEYGKWNRYLDWMVVVRERSVINILSGIVNYSSEESAVDKALEVAKAILPQAPLAIKMAKIAVDQGVSVDM